MTTAPKLEFNEGALTSEDKASSSDLAEWSSQRSSFALLSSDFNGFYEIESTVNSLMKTFRDVYSADGTDSEAVLFRVALQFPDYLLSDGPRVSVLLESALTAHLPPHATPLVYLLGDTTYGSCCVDEVAAGHLSSDVVVHYGRSCLTLNTRIPVIHVFGKLPVDVEHLCGSVPGELSKDEPLLVLYDVFYLHKISEIEEGLKARGFGNVVVGEVPKYDGVIGGDIRRGNTNTTCCGNVDGCGGDGGDCDYVEEEEKEKGEEEEGEDEDEETGSSFSPSITNETETTREKTKPPENTTQQQTTATLVLGGLKVDLPPGPSLPSYNLLYIGTPPTPTAPNHQLVNILMRSVGLSGTATQSLYDPTTNSFNTSPSKLCKRELQRRFYLTEKTKSANVIGIVVGTLGAGRFREVLDRVQRRCVEEGRKVYTFVVGKVRFFIYWGAIVRGCDCAGMRLCGDAIEGARLLTKSAHFSCDVDKCGKTSQLRRDRILLYNRMSRELSIGQQGVPRPSHNTLRAGDCAGRAGVGRVLLG